MASTTDSKALTKAEKRRLLINIIISLLIVVIVAAFFIYPYLPKKENSFSEFSAVDKICELATLRCYYHNVAEYEKQPDGIFRYGLFQYGYKKLWIEYDGIIEVGVNVGKVQVNGPDENGVVRVFVPEAEILGISQDESTLSIVMDTGVLTSITTQEKAAALSEAQSTMREAAMSDNAILSKAHNNAKALIKQYILNVGEQLGQEYKVEWLKSPEA